MIRAGIVAFAIGAICTLLVLTQLITGAELPSIMWFLAMLMGVGFAMILFGLLANARRRSAAVRQATSSDRP
jgi:hypothetical protein